MQIRAAIMQKSHLEMGLCKNKVHPKIRTSLQDYLSCIFWWWYWIWLCFNDQFHQCTI